VRILATTIGTAAILMGLATTAGAASTTGPLVPLPVSHVTIRYDAGLLAHEPHGCKGIPGCAAALRLSRLPHQRYGAWEARHLAWQLNHLRLMPPGIFCPVDFGNGFVLRFAHPDSYSVTVVVVHQTGCRTAVSDNGAHARWATSRLDARLVELLKGSAH